MSEIIRQGLLITAIGMGLVFVVIIFLWGLMALMMRLTSNEKKRKRKPEQPKEIKNLPAEIQEPSAAEQIQPDDHKQKAAAAAVAVGIAIENNKRRQKGRKVAEHSDGLSPWQAIHRMRQFGKRK